MPPNKRSLADLLDERFCYLCNVSIIGQPCYDYTAYDRPKNSYRTIDNKITLVRDELICEKCQWERIL